ncbi:MAG: aspartate/glutamate racemase family protein [Chloroflexota bacterium]
MKIVYLVPGPMGRTPEGQVELQRRGDLLQKYASPNVETGIVDVSEGPASIESAYEEYLAIPAACRKAVELEQEGWDAIILGCYGDPGLDALRELVSIPVIGPAEACALTMSSLGHRFGIITIAESVIEDTYRKARNAGVRDKIASVRVISTPVLELHKNRERTIDATVEQARIAMEQDRCDSFAVGCMSMGFLEVAEAAGAELGIPFLNPARTSVRFAEMLVGAGLTHSRKAYHVPPKLATGKVDSVSDLFKM